jgi:hypothetical protein
MGFGMLTGPIIKATRHTWSLSNSDRDEPDEWESDLFLTSLIGVVLLVIFLLFGG